MSAVIKRGSLPVWSEAAKWQRETDGNLNQESERGRQTKRKTDRCQIEKEEITEKKSRCMCRTVAIVGERQDLDTDRGLRKKVTKRWLYLRWRLNEREGKRKDERWKHRRRRSGSFCISWVLVNSQSRTYTMVLRKIIDRLEKRRCHGRWCAALKREACDVRRENQWHIWVLFHTACIEHKHAKTFCTGVVIHSSSKADRSFLTKYETTLWRAFWRGPDFMSYQPTAETRPWKSHSK